MLQMAEFWRWCCCTPLARVRRGRLRANSPWTASSSFGSACGLWLVLRGETACLPPSRSTPDWRVQPPAASEPAVRGRGTTGLLPRIDLQALRPHIGEGSSARPKAHPVPCLQGRTAYTPSLVTKPSVEEVGTASAMPKFLHMGPTTASATEGAHWPQAASLASDPSNSSTGPKNSNRSRSAGTPLRVGRRRPRSGAAWAATCSRWPPLAACSPGAGRP